MIYPDFWVCLVYALMGFSWRGILARTGGALQGLFILMPFILLLAGAGLIWKERSETGHTMLYSGISVVLGMLGRYAFDKFKARKG